MRNRVIWVNQEHTYRGQRMYAHQVQKDGVWVTVNPTIYADSAREALQQVTGDDVIEWND